MESEPGKGSCFSFTATFGRSDISRALLPHATPALGALNVLVVDDNASSRQILESMLGNLGFAVQLVANGRDAIERVKQAQKSVPFELVVIDWKMPGMDGIDTTRQILLDSGAHDAPACIMLTAFGRDEAVKAAAGVAIKVFLTKPVTASTLLDSIMTAMGMQPIVTSGHEREKELTDNCRAKLSGANILLVEDNALNQELALELLTQSGIQVTLANNGQEALDRLDEKRFDGVLMDCQMPVMDGYTATGLLRQQAQFKDLPILAMTANAMAGDRQKALDAGMNDHIAKPINPASMFHTIAKWIVPKNPEKMCPVATDTQPSKKPQWVAINGVNTKSGLARCQGNNELYQRLLKGYVATQSDFIKRFQGALSERDWVLAMRYAHDLKSTSGNIGADVVQELAAELEKACEQELDLGKLAGPMDSVDFHIATICHAIQANCTAEGTQKSECTANDPSTAAIDEELTKLSSLIAAHDTEALSVAEQLLMVHSAGKLGPGLERLVEQLNDWDFDAAREAMAALA